MIDDIKLEHKSGLIKTQKWQDWKKIEKIAIKAQEIIINKTKHHCFV